MYRNQMKVYITKERSSIESYKWGSASPFWRSRAIDVVIGKEIVDLCESAKGG
jgi:hypothetical protein